MTEAEKTYYARILDALMGLSNLDQQYVLGYAEGIINESDRDF